MTDNVRKLIVDSVNDELTKLSDYTKLSEYEKTQLTKALADLAENTLELAFCTDQVRIKKLQKLVKLNESIVASYESISVSRNTKFFEGLLVKIAKKVVAVALTLV